MRQLLHVLRKARGRTAAELLDRGRQTATAFAERRGFSRELHEPSAAEFGRLCDHEFADILRRGDETLLAYLRSRRVGRFFASLDDRERMLGLLRAHYPASIDELRARADRVREGEFDLLGHEGVSFGTPTDWHLDPTTGRRAPFAHWSRIDYLNAAVVGDHKVIWELNRHHHLMVLALAYWVTGDEAYAQTCASELAHWMDTNPPKRGINWASSLEIAFRSIAWLWILQLLLNSSALTPGLCRRLIGFLVRQGRHVETYLSTFFSPNTHLTGEALGLVYLGTVLPELRDAERWRRLGWAVLEGHVSRQVTADGVYFEQSSQYQRYTADFCLHALVLESRNGGASHASLAEQLHRMLEHLAHLTRPDGSMPLIGDDDGGRLLPVDGLRTTDCRSALATGALLFNDPTLAFVAGECGLETLLLLGPEAASRFASIGARPPESASRAFRDGGYCVMRDGWSNEANHLVIDCGPPGALSFAHSHADALAIDLTAAGTPILVDAGTFTYTTSMAERDYFRGSHSHNVVTVDDRPASVPAGAFAWSRMAQAQLTRWSSTQGWDFFEGTHDGYYSLPDAPRVSRAILFLKGRYWLVRDRVRGRDAHRAQLHFHTASGLSVSVVDEHTLMVARKEEPLLRLSSYAGVDRVAGSRIEAGWASSTYGARERCAHVVVATDDRAEHDLVSLLIPAHLDVEVTRELNATGGRALEVISSESRDIVLLGSAHRAVIVDDVIAECRWAWVRRDRATGRLEEFLLIDGRMLTVAGLPCVHADEPMSNAWGVRSNDQWRVQTEARGRVRVGVPDGDRLIVNDMLWLGTDQHSLLDVELARAEAPGSSQSDWPR